jgi:NNP family nitrate/nitrite transporter-like MFS transporter
MIPSIFVGKAKMAMVAGETKEAALLNARRLAGAVIGIAGAVGALGGVLINVAFRQSFLTTKSGDSAFWFFLAFYAVCVVVTYAVYLRRAPATELKHARRLAYAGV